MSDEFTPVIYAGSNIAVERTERGYRINAIRSPQAAAEIYTGYLKVLQETATGDTPAGAARLRVIDGSLPYANQLDYPAGSVEVYRLYLPPEEEEEAEPLQPLRKRYRVEIEPRSRLHLDEGSSVIYLSIHAVTGPAEDGWNEFTDPVWQTFHITAKCKAAPTLPEPEECEVFIVLATAEVKDGTAAIHQQHHGQPQGIIQELCEHEDSDSEICASSNSGSDLSDSRPEPPWWSLSSSSSSSSSDATSSSCDSDVSDSFGSDSHDDDSGSFSSSSSSSSSSSGVEENRWYGITTCFFLMGEWIYMGHSGAQAPFQTGIFNDGQGWIEVRIRTGPHDSFTEAQNAAIRWGQTHIEERCSYDYTDF